MSYATDFWEYLQEENKNEFTHRDILLVTGANCSYGILADLKDLFSKFGYKLTEKLVKSKTAGKKPFKRYYIEGV